jgi:predicted dehydrogenase
LETKQSQNLKFGVLGCGFWSFFQMSAWNELEGAELVALYNRTRIWRA